MMLSQFLSLEGFSLVPMDLDDDDGVTDCAVGDEESRAHLVSIPSDLDSKGSRAKVSIERLDRYSDEGTRIRFSVSFGVKAGEVMAIIGPSGNGKSTILRAINRLWEPLAGTIRVDGQDITKKDVLAVRRKCGMLFQTPLLFEGTVADNIRCGPSLEGKNLSKEEIEDLLILADLEPSFALKSIIGLSVGQAQRVALARTLANNPEILLLDEPTSALDPVSTRNIEQTLTQLSHTQGLTVLIVSHSLDPVRCIANTVCLVADGQVLEVMKPSELDHTQHPVVREFIAAAPKIEGSRDPHPL